MRRRLSFITAILRCIVENEKLGEATIFRPDRMLDGTEEQFNYFAPMLADNGFIRKVVEHPEHDDVMYRITWKGHCFLDLFDTHVAAVKGGDSMEILLTDLALASIH